MAKALNQEGTFNASVKHHPLGSLKLVAEEPSATVGNKLLPASQQAAVFPLKGSL